MSENNQTPEKKSISPDWLVRGVLSKIGETFDRLTGRNWKPSSSLATSELIDRLKKLLDAEAKNLNGRGKFVPHNIKLKMQWDKFSTDADASLKKLENELLIAAVDHINDNRYHTYASMSLEIKPDYFTEGVKLMASFDRFAEDEREAAVNVSVPDLKNVVIAPAEEIHAVPQTIFNAEFTVQNKTKQTKLIFGEKSRLSVGRTKENDLQIDDPSISKIHAALVLNSEKNLMVADTGSTNGTFINNQRIAYGKAIEINDADKLKFGNVEVRIERVASETEIEETAAEETVSFEAQQPTNATPKKENIVVIQPIAAASSKTNETNGEASDETNATSEPRIKLDFGDGK